MDSPRIGPEGSSKEIDPYDEGPCYDYCACDYCWRGWTTLSKKDRVINRLEWITVTSSGKGDSRYPEITQEQADQKIRDAIEWLLHQNLLL